MASPGGTCRERSGALRFGGRWFPNEEFARLAELGYLWRDVTYAALRRYAAGEDAVQEVTIAKLATARRVGSIDTCLQIHGEAGYREEYGIERAVWDARLGLIGGGPTRS